MSAPSAIRGFSTHLRRCANAPTAVSSGGPLDSTPTLWPAGARAAAGTMAVSMFSTRRTRARLRSQNAGSTSIGGSRSRRRRCATSCSNCVFRLRRSWCSRARCPRRPGPGDRSIRTTRLCRAHTGISPLPADRRGVFLSRRGWHPGPQRTTAELSQPGRLLRAGHPHRKGGRPKPRPYRIRQGMTRPAVVSGGPRHLRRGAPARLSRRRCAPKFRSS